MASPSRHICALILLAVLLPLAACGSDAESDATSVGEVVFARAGVDTEGAPKAHLLLPSGRLEIRAGKPVDRLAESDTRERSARSAPDGGVFVPLTWSYSTATMEKLAPVFGRTLPIDMTLVSGGERYNLFPPVAERDGEAAEAYYVAVEGTGEQVSVEVEYAGVTQSLDLVSGARKAGLAKGLYDLDPDEQSEAVKPCPSENWVDEGPLVQVDFTCTQTEPVVVPFIEGKWAPKNTSFAVIGLATTLASVAVYGTPGTGATYTVASSTEKTELAGEPPVTTINEQSSAGFSGGFLVFTLKGKLPKDLSFHRTYQLVRSTVIGVMDAPYERTLDISGSVPLR